MDDEKVYQVNLKEHIEKYVWKRMRKTEGFLKTMFMRKSRYYVDIKWGYLKFEHETEQPRQKVVGDKERKDAETQTGKYENKTENEQIYRYSTTRDSLSISRENEIKEQISREHETKEQISREHETKEQISREHETEEQISREHETKEQISQEHETKEQPRPRVVGDEKGKDVELYTCVYENKTGDEQIHKFSTSRETTATTKIELQENYTLGAETNIEVNIGCVKVGGKVNGGLSVTKTNGQEYSKSLTWNIDTEIKVPAKQRAIAKLHVSEDTVVTDFKVKTTVTLPKKKMPVSIRRIEDNKLIYTVWIQNLDAIFDDKFLKRAEDLIEVIDIPNAADKKIYIGLVLKSHGTCRNVSFRNQNVTVECTPLSDKAQPQKKVTEWPENNTDNDQDAMQESVINDRLAEADHDDTAPKSVHGIVLTEADDS